VTFFLIRAKFTSTLERFLPVGILATDGTNIIYKEVPNGVESSPFIIKTIEKLKLKYKNKKYTYKDNPKLFLELLIQHFAGFLTSNEEFHPLFIGSLDAPAENVAKEASDKLALFGNNFISGEDLDNLWPKS